MFDMIKKALGISKTSAQFLSKDEIAKMLGTNTEFLEQFEKAYEKASLESDALSGYINTKTAANTNAADSILTAENKYTLDRIVDELLVDTKIFEYRRSEPILSLATLQSNVPAKYVTQEEINQFPIENRPELSGNLMKTDIAGESYVALLSQLHDMQTTTNPIKQKQLYNMFRQGLDILDLDPVVYEMLSMNQNSMSFWLPAMIPAIEKEGFFLIPNTRIAKVPISMLQLTRLDYMSLSRSTLDIVDKWAQKAFDLDPSKKYFIKTGTYSSKFDFRNAKIVDPKEVMEIGEYLLFIHAQAISMAQFDLSGRGRPIMYGVSTTNEWVVREFIEDEDAEKLTIYHGLPLHTEYRVFVDFDTKEVLGIHPYWDPKVMKQRFGNMEDCNEPDMIHDYITYTAQELKLMARYEANKDTVLAHIQNLMKDVELSGQWSIDIMQNGNKFWFIDMAIADNSAFYEEVVPVEKRIKSKENWIPRLPNHE